ncbi:hypothetical protein OG887_01420 [Streptomyces sp. NBC_00053]|uniref:Uncharacterized protein n=1 Tax=Streptomyces sanglieri TaxID=193460 RepID=A0ABW2WQR1_9ACTN|nr:MULTISPECIES: hypothetical protein [unclassified Streptomyces]WSG55442.1 hypothetical protein OHA38_39795 [Streptomyces sp. NBC_01732]WSX06579.1 hypothetical protein OG355_42665 [Streptomyces sp. NBC_00987]MCX4391549.1 hypothetical protein [Streptomyces sp. NBC_01767]MCX5098250.1 hypothetical protein [Streptomyces sp. NBC_00439]MCX5165278.1 hypothetical protein [Streptomyces sp. NBC_00305]
MRSLPVLDEHWCVVGPLTTDDLFLDVFNHGCSRMWPTRTQ